MAGRDYYTVRQTAELCGLGAATVRDYMRKGVFRGRKVGRSWRVNKKEVDEFVSGDRPAGTEDENNTSQTVSAVFDNDTDELTTALAEFGESDDRVTCTLERLRPEEEPYGGYLESYDRVPRISEIKSKYGGGTYLITLISSDGRHRKVQKRISGEPVSPSPQGDDDDDFPEKSGRSRRARMRGRFAQDEYYGPVQEPNGKTGVAELMMIMQESSNRVQESMNQMIQHQNRIREEERRADQERYERERRERDERWERERRERDETHRREMELLEKKQNVEREREERRLEREREREQERMERERKRDDFNFKFLASMNEKREQAAENARQRIDSYHGQSVKHINDLMNLKVDLIDKEADRDRKRNDEIREALEAKGVEESTIVKIVQGLAEGAGKVADKFVANRQQQQPQQQHPMAQVPGAPVPPQGQQPYMGGVPQPQPDPEPEEHTRMPEAPRIHPESNEAQAVQARFSNSQAPTNGASHQPKGTTVALTDHLKNPVISDTLEMMAMHIANGVGPEPLADTILRMTEESVEVQFAVTALLGFNVESLVSLFPDLPDQVRLVLTSPQGHDYYEGLKRIIKEDFSSNDDDKPSNPEVETRISEKVSAEPQGNPS